MAISTHTEGALGTHNSSSFSPPPAPPHTRWHPLMKGSFHCGFQSGVQLWPGLPSAEKHGFLQQALCPATQPLRSVPFIQVYPKSG